MLLGLSTVPHGVPAPRESSAARSGMSIPPGRGSPFVLWEK